MATATSLEQGARGYFTWARANPAEWIERELGLELWSMQREIVESVRDHPRTSVRSCHGPGKTLIAAATAIWFLYCFPEAQVVTTATTWRQVEKLLWRELARVHRAAPAKLGGRLLKTELQLPDGRAAWGLSTSPDQQDSFQGLHSPHILLVIDEASGVPPIIWEQGESYMSTGNARLFAIGNPTQNAGEFYASHHAKRAEYNTFHISAYDTPAFTGENISAELMSRLVSREWVEGRKKSWGEGSSIFQIRCLGDFAKTSDDTVMDLALVEAAMEREIPDAHISPKAERVISCDVARFGSDETTIYFREGQRCRLLDAYTGKDTMKTAGRLVRLKKDLKATRIVIDDTGVGGGVTDRLRELGHSVEAFVAGGKPVDAELYENARAELWFNTRDELTDADIPNDDQLAADLVAPIYKYASGGQRKLEPKAETKKRLGRSPDRGDGLALLFAPSRESFAEVW